MGKRLIAGIAGLAAGMMLLSSGSQALAWESSQVHYNNQGLLEYAVDSLGNRIVDFSYAGYHLGEKAIPDSTALTAYAVAPVSGDNTAHIQQAIDTVSSWTPDAHGIRGTVRLAAGEYAIGGTLYIPTSGVILAGAGMGDSPTTNTILRRPYGGTANKAAVLIAGGNTFSNWAGGDIPGNRVNVTSSVVHTGDRSFDVSNAAGFSVGDNIIIKHPATQAWLDAVDGGGTYTGEPWAVDSQPLLFNRHITAISGNRITVDAPITNRLDASLSTSYVYKYDRADLVTEVGVENLQIVIDTKSPTSEDHAGAGIIFNTVEDGWVSGVKVKHFVNKGITLQSATRVTVRNSSAVEPHSKLEGGRRYSFAAEFAQLNLFIGNYASQGRHAYVGNGGSWDSGNVFVDNVASQSYDASELHRRWGHGFLYENHMETNVISSNFRVLSLYNRGNYGTSHGWSAANSVLWNCNVGNGRAVVEKPPTAQNYAIGCKGNITGAGPFSTLLPTVPGFIEGTGQTQMSIPSLYRAQLAERLGYSYEAAEDAYVRGGSYANENYGLSSALDIKNASVNYDRDAYIKVNMSGYNREALGKVILNFHVESNEPAQNVTFYGLTDDGWSENSITWNHVPSSAGASLIGTVSLAAPGWYSIDVTEYARSQADKVLTFKLTETASANQFSRISSRDSAAYRGPFLIAAPY